MKKKNNDFFYDIDIEPSLLTKCWWKTETFFKNWIYPGHYLHNFLFHNYNTIKLPMFKKYEYIDTSERIKFAIFELIKDFVENEDPEHHICWYVDPQSGIDFGHRYGEHKQKIMEEFKERKNEYIMDFIKEIYNFYTKVLPQLESEKKYLLDIWAKYILNGHYEIPKNTKDKDVYEWVPEPSNYTLEDLEKEDINWDILLKYIKEKKNIFDKCLVHTEADNIEKLIHEKTNYYLHLALEVREYLWV